MQNGETETRHALRSVLRIRHAIQVAPGPLWPGFDPGSYRQVLVSLDGEARARPSTPGCGGPGRRRALSPACPRLSATRHRSHRIRATRHLLISTRSGSSISSPSILIVQVRPQSAPAYSSPPFRSLGTCNHDPFFLRTRRCTEIIWTSVAPHPVSGSGIVGALLFCSISFIRPMIS